MLLEVEGKSSRWCTAKELHQYSPCSFERRWSQFSLCIWCYSAAWISNLTWRWCHVKWKKYYVPSTGYNDKFQYNFRWWKIFIYSENEDLSYSYCTALIGRRENTHCLQVLQLPFARYSKLLFILDYWPHIKFTERIRWCLIESQRVLTLFHLIPPFDGES